MKPMLGRIVSHGPVDFSLKLASVDFTGSDLSAATFSSETQFSDGTIGVNLNETNARIGTINGTVVDFSGAKLASVDFTGSDLSAATFSSETQFSDGYIGVNLNEPMQELNIHGTAVDFQFKLVSVDFTGSDLSSATFSSETQFSDGYIGVTSMKPMPGLVLLMALRLISQALPRPASAWRPHTRVGSIRRHGFFHFSQTVEKR